MLDELSTAFKDRIFISLRYQLGEIDRIYKFKISTRGDRQDL